jgi:polysaccharide export outer membrane protein
MKLAESAGRRRITINWSVIALLLLLVATIPTIAQEAQDKPAQTTPPAQQPAEAKPTEPTTGEPGATLPGAEAAPAAPVDPKTYKIGSEDVIHIQVWHDNDWTRSHMVRPDGKITLPLVGDIQAAGLTPEQLAKSVAQVLSKYINDPQVNVTVLQVRSKKYYITGEVNKPGSYPLITPTRILEALTNAGGFREFANLKKIRILRNGKTIKFNYKEVIHGKNLEQNIFVEDGDYIIVP